VNTTKAKKKKEQKKKTHTHRILIILLITAQNVTIKGKRGLDGRVRVNKK
jgi:hypothetical protein